MRVLLQSGTAAMGAGCAAQPVLVLSPFMVCTAIRGLGRGAGTAALRRAEQHRALQRETQGQQEQSKHPHKGSR